MSLGFALPSALLLAALVGLPIIAHLTKQIPKDRQAFGAMMLVRRVVKRLRRRRSLKDRLLFALRALALLALAFAASGLRFTYVGDIPDIGGSGRVVVIIDHSMSMGLNDAGSTLLERAKARAITKVGGLPESTLVGLVAYAGTSRPLTAELTTDHDRVVRMLGEVDVSLQGSDLRGALLDARRMLDGEPGEILLFSDEAGPVMIPAAEAELARIVETGSAVLPQAVHADPPRNIAVTSAHYGDGLEGGQVTLRVRNFGPVSIEASCEVVLPDGAQMPVFVDLPPDGEAEVRVTVPREAAGGVGRAYCEDPDLPADDRRYFHMPRVGASRVLVVDGDPGDTPTRSEVYFLERALAPWGGSKSGVRPDVISPKGLVDLDPAVHRVVFLANVADPRPVGPRLTDFVRRGGNLVVTAGDNITADRYNAALSAVLPAAFRRPMSIADLGEDPVPLVLPDLELPLFTPFSRSGRGGFARIGARRVLTLEPYAETADVTTLLRFEGGHPALVERRLGKGRVLVWTSSVDLGWGNLPLQSAFMPLMQRIVAYLGGEAASSATRLDATIGHPVSVSLPELTSEPEVVGPDGQPVRSHREGSSLSFTPERAGAYRVTVSDGPPLAWVAVNIDPLESDVRRTDSVAAVEAELEPELFARHVQLGGPLMGAAMSFLMFSALLAMWVTP